MRVFGEKLSVFQNKNFIRYKTCLEAGSKNFRTVMLNQVMKE